MTAKTAAFLVMQAVVEIVPPIILSMSFLTAIIPGGPGLAGSRMSPFWILLELRMTEVVSGDNWSYRT